MFDCEWNPAVVDTEVARFSCLFRDKHPDFRRRVVAKSVLEAIQVGQWDFEPETEEEAEFDSTNALPGSEEKLKVLATRIQSGLPLWHPSDRHTYDGQMLAALRRQNRRE